MIDQLYETKTEAFEAGKLVGRFMILTAEERARATQAVLDYFHREPTAGEPPYFHHRQGIALAVIEALTGSAEGLPTDETGGSVSRPK